MILKASLYSILCPILILATACSPKPTAKEAALQKRIDSLEARIHTLELDRSLIPGSAYNRFPNLRIEAQAEGKLASQKAQFEALESLSPTDRSNAIIAMGLGNAQLKTLKEDLANVDDEIASFQDSLGPTHPKMIGLQTQRERILKIIDRETEDAMFGLKTQLEISTRWVAAMKKPDEVSVQP